MEKIKVLIVDDHPVVLDGLSTMISYRDRDVEVYATCTTGADAIATVARDRPDVIVMDVKLPDMTGLEASRRILRHDPTVRILILTSYEDPEYLAEALQSGARGFLLKDSLPEDILRAIRSVASDNLVFSGKLASQIDQRPPRDTEAAEEMELIASQLTPREREILKLVAGGYDNREIGEALGISEKTVRNYVSRIYDALDIHTRPRVIRWALENKSFTEI